LFVLAQREEQFKEVGWTSLPKKCLVWVHSKACDFHLQTAMPFRALQWKFLATVSTNQQLKLAVAPPAGWLQVSECNIATHADLPKMFLSWCILPQVVKC